MCDEKKEFPIFGGEPLRFGFASLASGYPLHHLLHSRFAPISQVVPLLSLSQQTHKTLSQLIYV